MLIKKENRVKYTVSISALNPFYEILLEEEEKRGFFPESIKDSAILYEFKEANQVKLFEDIREHSSSGVIQAFLVKKTPAELIFETGYSIDIHY